MDMMAYIVSKNCAFCFLRLIVDLLLSNDVVPRALLRNWMDPRLPKGRKFAIHTRFLSLSLKQERQCLLLVRIQLGGDVGS